MNESQIRTKFRKFLKGVVFVDKNNYKREIPIELTEDWIIEQFQQYKAELLRDIEGMKQEKHKEGDCDGFYECKIFTQHETSYNQALEDIKKKII